MASEGGSGPVDGEVVSWHEEDGWGVLRSEQLPADVWAHFGAIKGAEGVGVPGERVRFTYAEPGQDGYRFRALEVQRPQAPAYEPVRAADGAYRSTVTITWDDGTVTHDYDPGSRH